MTEPVELDLAALIAAMQATAAAVKPRPVDVPGWGRLYVKTLTVAEVDANTEADAKSPDKQRLARGAARVIVGADGTRRFDPDNPVHVALLAAQPWSLLQLVIARANEHNALDEAGQAEAGNA